MGSGARASDIWCEVQQAQKAHYDNCPKNQFQG